MHSSKPIGACVIVENSQNQILLGKRQNSYKSGYWGLPGCRIELHESIESTAQRELAEETSLIANSLKYLGVIRENQGDYNFIHFVFVCKIFSGHPQCLEPNKCELWQWFSFNNLPSPILRGHQAAITDLWQKQSFLIDLPTLTD